MTDRMLSAEKVKAWIDINSSVYRTDTGGLLSWQASPDAMKLAINSGQLDADRPECPKCGDTGETIVGEHARWTDRCDCKASK